MSAAVICASPSVQGSRGTSRYVTCAGTSVSSRGKSGGEKERAIRSSSEATGDGGPHTSTTTSGCHNGAKKRRPSTWSRWRCVSRIWIRRASRSRSSSPRSLIPVPASRTSVEPTSSVTSTHDVLPPASTVLGPGVGTEPRHPHTFRRIARSRRLAPEDPDDADELVGVREERKGRHRYLSLETVRAGDHEARVGR